MEGIKTRITGMLAIRPVTFVQKSTQFCFDSFSTPVYDFSEIFFYLLSSRSKPDVDKPPLTPLKLGGSPVARRGF